MQIVGGDFHPSFQQIAILNTETGEMEERRLEHGNGAAEQFYRELEAPALIGMEAVGNSLWFEQLMAGLGHEPWIGDARFDSAVRFSTYWGRSTCCGTKSTRARSPL